MSRAAPRSSCHADGWYQRAMLTSIFGPVESAAASGGRAHERMKQVCKKFDYQKNETDFPRCSQNLDRTGHRRHGRMLSERSALKGQGTYADRTGCDAYNKNSTVDRTRDTLSPIRLPIHCGAGLSLQSPLELHGDIQMFGASSNFALCAQSREGLRWRWMAPSWAHAASMLEAGSWFAVIGTSRGAATTWRSSRTRASEGA